MLLLPGDGGECLMVSALYAPTSQIADHDAEIAAGRLAPVLERYFRLYHRLQADDRRLRALSVALDLTNLAVLVLNDMCELLFANRAASDMLDRRDGLRRQGVTIAATDLGGAVRLQVSIQHAIANRGREGGDGALRL